MNLKRIITTVDTHTAGGPTRTAIAGIPPLEGHSVAEKMEYFRTHFDSLRKFLMLEPRGHRDMSGAVLTSSGEAPTGAFFITSTGYLRACVHSSIGLVTAGLETGFIPNPGSGSAQAIQIEVPAGLVSVIPRYKDRKLTSVAIQTPPAFLCGVGEPLRLNSFRTLEATLAYSGVFFVLLNAKTLDLPKPYLHPKNAKTLAEVGVEILAAANQTLRVTHPENPESSSFSLAMIYEDLGDRHARDIVIGPTGTIDRSPCGAGMGAIMTYLFSQGKLRVGEDFILDSFLETRFIGRIVSPATVGSFDGAVPEIAGSAYVTGLHQFVLDSEDPLVEGIAF
jgi:proline racemase